MNDAPPPGPGMHDYWLRGDDEAAVLSAMAEAAIPTLPSTESSFDSIGTIWKDTGTVDAEGNPVMEPLPGWHANLRLRHELTLDEEAALAAVLIPPPAHPVRVWG